MTVRIAARLTKDEQEHNGLDAIVGEIVKEGPDWRGIAVVKLSRKRVTHEDDTDQDIPTVNVDHIEPLFGIAAEAAGRLCIHAYNKRLGRVALWDDDDPDIDSSEDLPEDPDGGLRPIDTVHLPDGDIPEWEREVMQQEHEQRESAGDPVFTDLDATAGDTE